MEELVIVLVCLIAGVGAGLGTGFAGMSAAAVIAPLLTTFLKVDAYEAVGIALASDVLASAASTLAYAKNKNLDIKNGIIMMVSVLAFTFVGSLLSSLLKGDTMGSLSVVLTLFLGLKFIIKPVTTTKDKVEKRSKKVQVIGSILCGSIVGFICGFVGAGGGMMMLIILTLVLGYELKTAIGTSVFIMTFTALTGAVSHFAIRGMHNAYILVLCVIFTLMFALIGSKIANKVDNKKLNRLLGSILVVLGAVILLVKYVF